MNACTAVCTACSTCLYPECVGVHTREVAIQVLVTMCLNQSSPWVSVQLCTSPVCECVCLRAGHHPATQLDALPCLALPVQYQDMQFR